MLSQGCVNCKTACSLLFTAPFAKCVLCSDPYCSTNDRDGSACISVPDYPKDWACPPCRRKFQKTPEEFTAAQRKILRSEMNVSPHEPPSNL